MLSSKREEAQALAAFHMVMEAGIKAEQDRKEVSGLAVFKSPPPPPKKPPKPERKLTEDQNPQKIRKNFFSSSVFRLAVEFANKVY